MTITEFIEAQLARIEQVAREATPPTGSVYEWVDVLSVERDATPATDEHILTHDSAHVLAWVAAIRAVVAEVAGWRHEVVEDCWYTCAAATEEREGEECCDDNRRGGACDCGRDYRVQRILAPIAGIWAGQDGWQEGWK